MGKKKKHGKAKANGEQKTPKTEVENKPDVTKKPNRERLVWIFLSSFLFVISVVMLIYTFGLVTEVSNYDENLVNCSLALDEAIENERTCTVKMGRLEKELEALHLGVLGGYEFPEKIAKELDGKGLKPNRAIDDIKTSLVKKREIIPYKDISESKLRFYNRQEIYVISPKKVFATFSDNENYGWLLLRYTVYSKEDIRWKVIDSYCEYYDK